MKLDSLTNLVYQGALDGQWQPFIRQLMVATDSFNGWLATVDSEALNPIFTEFISSSEEVDNQYFVDKFIPHMAKDPYYIHSQHVEEAHCFRGSDVAPAGILQSLPHYSVYERAGCEFVMGSVPIRSPHFNSVISLNRNKQQSDFSLDDLQLLKLITPHINRAVQLHLKLFYQQQKLSLYQSILASNPYPLLIIDTHQNILQINPIAEQLLRRQTILSTKLDKLSTGSIHDSSKIRDFIHSTLSWIQAKSPEPTAITLTKGSEKIMLRAYPVHAESDINNYNNPCCVVEILSTKEPNWQLFQEEFSITPKELRTVQFLYQGLNLNEAAQKSNLSFNTVKSQLMSVYGKTALNSQRELIANLVKYI